jgi:hypothetical protein
VSNVLILGPGQHREFGLRSLREAGHTIGVVDDLGYFSPELTDWYVPFPPAAMTDPRTQIARSGIAWDAVLAWGELSLEPSLRVARQLGLPCAALDVGCFRNKATMRQRQLAAGLRVPDFLVTDDARQARAWLAQRDLPVIVKPVDYGGSSGVRVVGDRGELGPALRRAVGKSLSSQAIVETLVDGPEFSVETVSFGAGRHHSYGVIAKTVTEPPFCVEIGHDYPADLPADIAEAIIGEVHRTLDAFGMETGATHAEVKLSPDGPCVIEIGGRLAGDYIPQIIWLASGVNLYLEELHAILGGQAPATATVTGRAAAMRVLRAEPGGVLRWRESSVVVGTALERTLAGLHRWYPDYCPVPVIDSSARRLGACLLVGPPDEVRAACDVVRLLEPEILEATP